jgi:hypothetical protein
MQFGSAVGGVTISSSPITHIPKRTRTISARPPNHRPHNRRPHNRPPAHRAHTHPPTAAHRTPPTARPSPIMACTTVKKGGFSVGIVHNSVGEITDGGHVPIAHEAEYKIRLGNDGPTRCDVDVTMDGEPVGRFQLAAWAHCDIERPGSLFKGGDPMRMFTFLKETSTEAASAGIAAKAKLNGVIDVFFTPEAAGHEVFLDSEVTERGEEKGASRGSVLPVGSSGPPRGKRRGGYMSGATALGRASTQQFHTVAGIDSVDKKRETRIIIRLVCIEGVAYEAVACRVPSRVD